MNRFYIEKLVVSGGGCKTNVIDFQPGLNFILGPSNTGKSLIMDCIDYVFGFTPRKSHPSKIVDNNYGYNHIFPGSGVSKFYEKELRISAENKKVPAARFDLKPCCRNPLFFKAFPIGKNKSA